MTFANNDWITPWSQIVISLGIIFGGISVVFRWMKKNVSNPLKAVPIIQAQTDENHQALAKLSTDLNNVTGEVAKIKAEVTPNGGASLRDSVIRQEEINANAAIAVESIDKNLKDHLINSEEITKTLTSAISELETKVHADNNKTKTATNTKKSTQSIIDEIHKSP